MTIIAPALPSVRARAWMLSSIALVTLWPVAAGRGQNAQQPATPIGPPQHVPDDTAAEPNPFSVQNNAKLGRMRDDERRKRLLTDADKLVSLSTELKVQIEKTSKDQLSLDVVKKAAEIEKLAHDVKERMKS